MSSSDLLNILESNPLFSKTRLPSLYSDFRKLKISNVDGFNANLNAWKSLLLKSLEKGAFKDKLQLTADNELVHSLQLPGVGIPLAIDCVLVSKTNHHNNESSKLNLLTNFLFLGRNGKSRDINTF